MIVQKNGHYPQDHDYPPVPREAVLGDCWHRFYVRMLEVVQSMDIVRQAMDKYSYGRRRLGHPDQAQPQTPGRRSVPGDGGPEGADGVLRGQ